MAHETHIKPCKALGPRHPLTSLDSGFCRPLEGFVVFRVFRCFTGSVATHTHNPFVGFVFVYRILLLFPDKVLRERNTP